MGTPTNNTQTHMNNFSHYHVNCTINSTLKLQSNNSGLRSFLPVCTIFGTTSVMTAKAPIP